MDPRPFTARSLGQYFWQCTKVVLFMTRLSTGHPLTSWHRYSRSVHQLTAQYCLQASGTGPGAASIRCIHSVSKYAFLCNAIWLTHSMPPADSRHCLSSSRLAVVPSYDYRALISESCTYEAIVQRHIYTIWASPKRAHQGQLVMRSYETDAVKSGALHRCSPRCRWTLHHICQ